MYNGDIEQSVLFLFSFQGSEQQQAKFNPGKFVQQLDFTHIPVSHKMGIER